MNLETKKVVVLNTASAMLWQMLSSSVSWREIEEILQQVYPPELQSDAINASKALLTVLMEANIILAEERTNESIVCMAE